VSTSTETRTFTSTDIRRVLASFASDFGMIADATGTQSREHVTETVSDLVGFALAGYLVAVDLILRDGTGETLRAAKYVASTAAFDWDSARPGNNLWPREPGGRLQVVATLSSAWWALDETAKERARQTWGIARVWGVTTTDTTHAGLMAAMDRRFASNGYGMVKTIYRAEVRLP